MNRRRRKKTIRILPQPTSARWDFWKSKQGKFAARFSIGCDGYVIPFIEALPTRFPHIVFGLSSTIRAHSTERKLTNTVDVTPRWHRLAVRFSAKLDPRTTFDDVFSFLSTCARIEGGVLVLPDFPQTFTERRNERSADVRKRLRRGRSYASF